jgi:hypothetical protein
MASTTFTALLVVAPVPVALLLADVKQGERAAFLFALCFGYFLLVGASFCLYRVLTRTGILLPGVSKPETEALAPDAKAEPSSDPSTPPPRRRSERLETKTTPPKTPEFGMPPPTPDFGMDHVFLEMFGECGLSKEKVAALYRLRTEIKRSLESEGKWNAFQQVVKGMDLNKDQISSLYDQHKKYSLPDPVFFELFGGSAADETKGSNSHQLSTKQMAELYGLRDEIRLALQSDSSVWNAFQHAVKGMDLSKPAISYLYEQNKRCSIAFLHFARGLGLSQDQMVKLYRLQDEIQEALQSRGNAWNDFAHVVRLDKMGEGLSKDQIKKLYWRFKEQKT